MLCAMEGKVGKYKITAKGFIFDWSWHLLPSIAISFDEVGIYIVFEFLCFDLNIDIEDQIKAQEWEDKLEKIFKVKNND